MNHRLSPSILITITILYMTAIILLSISKDAGFPGDTGRLINNAAHIPIFFILTVLYLLSFNSLNLFNVITSYLCALILAIIFSALTEYLQSHTVYRTASLIDFTFNITGIILALMFNKIFHHYFNRL